MQFSHALFSTLLLSAFTLMPAQAKDMSKEVIKQHKLSEIATTKIHPKVEDCDDLRRLS